MLKNLLLLLFFALIFSGYSIYQDTVSNANPKKPKYYKLTDNIFIFHSFEEEEKKFYVHGEYVIVKDDQHVANCKLSLDHHGIYRFDVSHIEVNPNPKKTRNIIEGEARFSFGLYFTDLSKIKDKSIVLSFGDLGVQLIRDEINQFHSGPLISTNEQPQAFWLVYHDLLNREKVYVTYSQKTDFIYVPESYAEGIEQLKVCLSEMNDFLFYRQKDR